MGFFDIFRKSDVSKIKTEIKFKEEVNPIFESKVAKEQIAKAEKADKEKTKKMSEKLTDEENKFIKEFMNKAKEYAKGNKIVYNFRGGNINFEIKGMQIGRISLNEKNRTMQILTKDDVKWITPISYEDAIKNIDKWIKYMKYLLRED